MKAVLFGTSEFAVPALHAIAGAFELAGVVTQPDRPAGRGHKLTPSPVKAAALAREIPVMQPERLRPFVDELASLAPDAIVVASYGKILPQALLDVPRLLAFNIHPSLLPLYRGATPLQSALRDGRATTGVTIIAMDAGMDTGDILLQETTAIGDRETYAQLHDRLAADGARLVVDAMRAALDGPLARTPQSAMNVDEAQIAATTTRPLRKEELVIGHDRVRPWTAQAIVDFVRSLSPRPGAKPLADDAPYVDEASGAQLGAGGTGVARVIEAHVDPDGPCGAAAQLPAGRAIAVDGRLWISAIDGVAAIDRLAVAGGKEMSASQYRAGHRVSGPGAVVPALRIWQQSHAAAAVTAS